MDETLESKILKDLGWSDEFMIPVANDENKKLASQIRDLIQKKAQLLSTSNDQDLKQKYVKKSIKSTIDAINYNNDLINSQQNQLNSHIAESLRQTNEISHNESQLKQMRKKKAHIEDRLRMLAFEENKFKMRIEKQKGLIEWAENVLEEANSELDREDNVLDLMEKYQMQDREQFKEDELKRQRLLKDFQHAETILQNEVAELKAREIEFEQILKMGRQLNKERNTLIDQWEYSMKILKLRDVDICVVDKQIESLEKEVGEETLRLEEEKKNLDEELRTNQERAQARRYYSNECNGFRIKLQQMNKELNELRHEKRFLSSHLLELNHDKKLYKRRIRTIQNQTRDKKQRLEQLEKKQEDLKQKLNSVDSEVKSTDETVKQLHELLKHEQLTHCTLNKDLEKICKQLSGRVNEITNLRAQYESRSKEIEASEGKLHGLLREESKTLELLGKQSDLLHRRNVELGSVQMKIIDLQGVKSDEYMQALEKELRELIEKKKGLDKCLDTAKRESKRMDVEIVKTMLQIRKDQLNLDQAKAQLVTARVAVDGKTKLLGHVRNQNQELAMHENMLQLRRAQLRSQMIKHSNQVYSLEKTRIEMDSIIATRRAEIETAKSVLLTRKRTLMEIRSNLKRSLDHLTVRIDQLKTRFDVIVYSLEGEVYNCVAFTIQNIQEKHVLLEQGNELEADIIKAEKEIIALENTVQVVNSSNVSYKSAVFQVEEYNLDIEQDIDKQLEQELCVLEDIQSDVAELTKDIQTLEENLTWLIDRENQLTKQWTDKDNKVQQLGVELNQQTTKLIRAEKQIKQLKRTLELIGHEKQPMILLAEKDLCTKELIESNESALQQLAELSVRHPETAPILSQYLSHMKLSLPLRHSPATSVLSARSQMSDLNSVRSFASSTTRLGSEVGGARDPCKLGAQWREKSSMTPLPSNQQTKSGRQQSAATSSTPGTGNK
uniref:Coiled-coil domain-containing protein 39 n=1 Tax=Cacopsylla melanoneura TaxID=428564 RepID=A0A8D8Z5U4_9HEMI